MTLSTMLPGMLVARRVLAQVPAAAFHTSALAAAAPRPNIANSKLKSHSGAKKRFFPVIGSAKGSAVTMKFTRGSANKQHLNSGMSRVRLNRLGGTTMVSGGAMAKVLRRMLGPRM